MRLDDLSFDELNAVGNQIVRLLAPGYLSREEPSTAKVLFRLARELADEMERRVAAREEAKERARRLGLPENAFLPPEEGIGL
ncbi:MAG TPA: hypothetical protein GX515_10105 [Firmicutes bacterium]|nr:hypothetical protein [Bacillota bacterium]